MKVSVIPVTPLQQNCSVLVCEKTGKAAVVDPGADLDDIVALIEKLGGTLEKILVTHGHTDHAGGVSLLAKRFGVPNIPIEGPHPDDQFWIERIPLNAPRYGLVGATAFTPDRWLAGGDTVRFGEVELEVRHCPGHTPGHVIFFSREHKLAMVGDVLFQGSIGRTDFPRGDHDTLLRSIATQLWPLGDDVTFIPGHGPLSTFGEERASNPYVADDVLQRAGIL
jgi:glyoxylase-like metal-dependent hydrolase (beta-lactamase superfamily II)